MVRLIHKQGEQSRSQKLNRWFFSLIYCINVLFLSATIQLARCHVQMTRSRERYNHPCQVALQQNFLFEPVCYTKLVSFFASFNLPDYKRHFKVFVYHSHWLALIPLLQESDMVEHSFSWCYLIEIRPWKKVFWKCYQSIAFGLCLNIISEKINKNLFALIVSDRGIWRWLFCYVLSPTSCKTVIYFVTMVGNVPWSKADNTPWSHNTVTPLPTMFKHGRQWKTMHGTMVNLSPGKEEKREKAMVALLFFIMATLEIVFGRSKAVGRKRSIWR